jgi:hypothetical protein
MCQTVGTDAWTGEGSEWATKLVIKDGESTSQWTSRIQSKVPIKNGPAFLSCINGLYSIFQKAPRGSNQHGQDDFFRQHNQTLSHDIGDIENMIDDMCNILSKLLKVPENFVTHPRSGWSATRLFQSLRIQVLPLLLMVLKASFSTGYAEMQNRLLLGESQISTSTFSLMLKIIDCATQICAVMIEYLQHSSAEDQKIFSRPYLLMSHQIALFKAELQEASDTTTQRPACNRERRTLAIDKDRQVRQAREAKARRRQADAGTQTMLYLRSTQKLDVRRSGSGDSRHDSSSQRHKSGRPWSHDEDDAVLSLIRKFKPSYTIMAELLVGRTGEEVELRARELREVCRKRYEIDWGMIPPQWCYN